MEDNGNGMEVLFGELILADSKIIIGAVHCTRQLISMN